MVPAVYIVVNRTSHQRSVYCRSAYKDTAGRSLYMEGAEHMRLKEPSTGPTSRAGDSSLYGGITSSTAHERWRTVCVKDQSRLSDCCVLTPPPDRWQQISRSSHTHTHSARTRFYFCRWHSKKTNKVSSSFQPLFICSGREPSRDLHAISISRRVRKERGGRRHVHWLVFRRVRHSPARRGNIPTAETSTFSSVGYYRTLYRRDRKLVSPPFFFCKKAVNTC